MNKRTEQDILYIHPPKLPGWVTRKWREAFASFQVMPMGAVALANLLREDGFPVPGLNYAMELDLDPLFDLRAWLEACPSPLLVVLDLHWIEHSFGTLEVARVCKEVYPGVPVAIGGLTASLYAQEILGEFPQVDYVIRGDAEAGLVGLSRHLVEGQPDLQTIPNLSLRIAGQVVENPLTYIAGSDDLEGLDFVSIDFLVHQEEYYWRQSSRYRQICGHWLCVGRGCRHDCCWCGGSRSVHERIFGRSKLVVRSPARLVDNLGRLYQLGVDQAALSHDLAQPERFGLGHHWNGFLDYYRYCQCSTEAKDDEAAMKLRGFEMIEYRPLADMFEKWVALCRQLGEDTCLHFP